MESHRETFYSSLAEIVDSLRSITESLRILVQQGETPGCREIARTVLDGVARGLPLSGSMQCLSVPVPAGEIALIRAGEQGGKLSTTLRELAATIRESRERRRSLLLRLAYPIFLIHAALLTGTFISFLRNAPHPWIFFFACVILLDGSLVLCFRALRRLPNSPSLSDTARRLPLAGAMLSEASWAGFSRMLGRLYGAGVPLGRAFRESSASCICSQHRTTAETAASRIENGQSAAEAFAQLDFAPSRATAALAVAERAGNLEKALLDCGVEAAERLNRKLAALARRTGIAAYAFAILYASWTIVSFWLRTLAELNL